MELLCQTYSNHYFLLGNGITGINIKARFANGLHLATIQAKVTAIG